MANTLDTHGSLYDAELAHAITISTSCLPLAVLKLEPGQWMQLIIQG